MLHSRSLFRRRPLGGRPFQLLLASLAVSSCGDWVYNLALLALVFERTTPGRGSSSARLVGLWPTGMTGGG